MATRKVVMADVSARDGLYGAGFAWSETCGSSRALSFWRDEEALMAFVLGEPNAAAIAIMKRATYGGETTPWTESTDTQPATSAQAKAKLDEVREK